MGKGIAVEKLFSEQDFTLSELQQRLHLVKLSQTVNLSETINLRGTSLQQGKLKKHCKEVSFCFGFTYITLISSIFYTFSGMVGKGSSTHLLYM